MLKSETATNKLSSEFRLGVNLEYLSDKIIDDESEQIPSGRDQKKQTA